MGATKTLNLAVIEIKLFLKREQTPLPPLQSYFAAVVDFTSLRFNYLRSSSKRETDALKITTLLPASDSLFGSRHIQTKLCYRGVITSSFSTGTEKPRIRKLRNTNTLCKQLIIKRRRMNEQFQNCSPLFKYSNMKVRRCYVK